MLYEKIGIYPCFTKNVGPTAISVSFFMLSKIVKAAEYLLLAFKAVSGTVGYIRHKGGARHGIIYHHQVRTHESFLIATSAS